MHPIPEALEVLFVQVDHGTLASVASHAQDTGVIDVETIPAGVRVTIPNGEVDPAQLDELLRWLRLESATRRSAMTEAEADAMAEAGKAQWWAENKSRFIPPEP